MTLVDLGPVRPDTSGIKLTPAMSEALKCVVWAQQNDPTLVDMFWEDLAILVDGVDQNFDTH